MSDEMKVPRQRAMSLTHQLNYDGSLDLGVMHDLVESFGGRVISQTHDHMEVELDSERAKELMREYNARDVASTFEAFKKANLAKVRNRLTESITQLGNIYGRLARDHELYARLVPADSFDGENARRWAVRNAQLAGYDDYVDELISRYLDEPGVSDQMRQWLLGGHWARAKHLECLKSSGRLRELMALTEDEGTASTLAFAIITLEETSKEIERWEGAAMDKPPWELRDAFKEAETLGQTLLDLDSSATAEEREAAFRETGDAFKALAKEAGRWARYHSGVATQTAITSRLHALDSAQKEEHIKALRTALENVLNAETLEEAEVIASRELAVSMGYADPGEEELDVD